MIGLVQAMQRVLGITNRELGARLGISTSCLSRLFKRKMALSFEHVLAIVTALGLHWSEFFGIAYPHGGQEPSAVAKQFQALFELTEGTGNAGKRAF